MPSRELQPIADSLERFWGVHDVVSLGVSASRGHVHWSRVSDVSTHDSLFVAAFCMRNVGTEAGTATCPRRTDPRSFRARPPDRAPEAAGLHRHRRCICV